MSRANSNTIRGFQSFQQQVLVVEHQTAQSQQVQFAGSVEDWRLIQTAEVPDGPVVFVHSVFELMALQVGPHLVQLMWLVPCLYLY